MKKRIPFACLLAVVALFIFSTLVYFARAQTYASVTITSSPATGSGFVEVDATPVMTPTTPFNWTTDDTHTLFALPSVPDGPDTQYVFTSWSAPSFGSSLSQSYTYTVPGSDETVTANYQTQYWVTYAANVPVTLPANEWVASGNAATGVFPSPVISGGTRYVFVSDDRPSTITAPTTITATYKTQYQHTITSSPATGSGYLIVDGSSVTTPYTTPWWDSGSSHTLAANSPVTLVSGQSQYTYSSWSDSGAQSHSVSPTTVTTFIAVFQLQYFFSVSSTNDNPTGAGWYNAGSSVSSTVIRPVSGGTGIQYETTGWTGTGSLNSGGSVGSSSTGSFALNAYTTCTWNWKTQYYLTVTSSYGSPSPTSGWFDSNSVITASALSPVSGPPGTQYICTGWTGTGSVPASGSTSSTSFAIGAPSGITWNWKTQYQVTFEQSGIGSDFLNWVVVTVDGHDYGVSNLPVSFWYDSGSLHTFDFQSYLIVGSSTKQYAWTSTSGLTTLQSGTLAVTSGGSVIGGYKTQYYLSVSSPYDSPSPSSGWVDSGSGVTASVTSPASGGQYVCTGWTGTGSVPSSGSSTSVTFTITAASSITWIWQSFVGQISLTVSSSHDSPNPSVGQHYYTNGSSVTCLVVSPVTEGSNVWTCTGWTGTGSVPSSGPNNSVTFTITQDSTITWNWMSTPITHKLTVVSAHGSPNPGNGQHTYGDGSSVTCNVTSPVTEGGNIWTCTGWTGTGSVPSSGTGYSTTFTITKDSSITWNWASSPVQRRLTVNSAHDSPNPGNGQHEYADGTQVNCSVSPSVNEGGTIWICTGWTGTGSVPSSGTDANVDFNITQNSTITWNWHNSTVQQYKLTINSSHGNPSPSLGDHLYDDGASVTCSVPSPVIESGVTYMCTGWNGTGSVPSNGSDSSVTFTISENSTLTWNWQAAQWTLTVTSTHGTPNPGTGDHFYLDGSNITCNVSSPVIEANVSYTCTGWSGTGSAPSSGVGTSTTFIINENSTITWNWIQTGQCLLTVNSAHGTPSPDVGNSSYQNGSSVTCTVASPVNENGTVWICTGWTGTGSVQSTGSDATVTFSITQNSTITWNWIISTSAKLSLTVVSAHGLPNPTAGVHIYDNGTNIICSVASPVTESNLTYECTGWTGTGSVTSNGSGTSITLVITENSTITWNWKQRPNVSGSDSKGNTDDIFSINETIYVTGSAYPKNQTFAIYFVNETTWVNGMTIPERIPGTLSSISSDTSGNIEAKAICNETLTPGTYNILIDLNGNGKYDAQNDTLCSIQVSSTLNTSISIPEYVFGTILSLIGCFAALVVFRLYKNKRPKTKNP